MPKNIYKEKWEQLQLDRGDEIKALKETMLICENNFRKLALENASLKERLRLVEIAARGE